MDLWGVELRCFDCRCQVREITQEVAPHAGSGLRWQGAALAALQEATGQSLYNEGSVSSSVLSDLTSDQRFALVYRSLPGASFRRLVSHSIPNPAGSARSEFGTLLTCVRALLAETSVLFTPSGLPFNPRTCNSPDVSEDHGWGCRSRR